MTTRLSIARDALENLNEDAGMLSIEVGRKMLDCGINPVAVQEIAKHYPGGGPEVDGWRWAFRVLVDAGAAGSGGYYPDAVAAGYYETN